MVCFKRFCSQKDSNTYMYQSIQDYICLILSRVFRTQMKTKLQCIFSYSVTAEVMKTVLTFNHFFVKVKERGKSNNQ